MDDQPSDADLRGSVPADARHQAQLERILRDALLCKDETALIAAEQEALEEVVTRHHGESMTLEPIAVDLVAALLGAAFRIRVEDSPLCIRMSRTVAASLWSDPVVRQRMERLWSQLVEPA